MSVARKLYVEGHTSIIKPFLYAVLLLLTLVNLYLLSFSILHGEINFFNDVARDFLLLQELGEKKIILIGPRAGVAGLFHGPLWTYINYPVYLLGNGDPVTIAWFWVVFTVSALCLAFFLAKKLFGRLPALAYLALFSAKVVPHTNGILHAEAAIFFVPCLFFTIVRYIERKTWPFLIAHLLVILLIIQLDIGIGIPFLLLSIALTSFVFVRHRRWKHFLSYLVIVLFLGNFLVFDMRHDFSMTKVAMAFSQTQRYSPKYAHWLEDRIHRTVDLQLYRGGPEIFSPILFMTVILFTIVKLKKAPKQRHVFTLFLFYYFGYMLLSLLNKGVILFHFIYPLIALTTLWFTSFLGSRYKFIFLPLFLLVAYFNLGHNQWYIKDLEESFMGKHINSWKGLSTVAQAVIDRQGGRPFGYFVFAPDLYAYQPRYAMMYHFKAAHSAAFEYTKKTTTFVIAAPPPPNDPYMTYVWWRKNPVNIASKPVWTQKFPNGFIIEEFHLSEKEQALPHDKTIELGIHFR